MESEVIKSSFLNGFNVGVFQPITFPPDIFCLCFSCCDLHGLEEGQMVEAQNRVTPNCRRLEVITTHRSLN